MAVTLTHRAGEMDEYVDDADLDDLVAELDGPEDSEHPDVSVAHESGWALSAFPSGLVVWEDVEATVARVIGSLSVAMRCGGFRLPARNELGEVASSGWQPGYGVERSR